MSDLKAQTLAGKYLELGSKAILETGEQLIPSLVCCKGGKLMGQCFINEFPESPYGRAMQVARCGALFRVLECDEVGLVVDTMVAQVEDPAEYEQGRPLPVDDPTAKDCLVVVEAKANGTPTYWAHLYSRNDDGSVSWGDSRQSPEWEGDMADVMQKMVGEEFLRATPPSDLADCLMWLGMHDITVALLQDDIGADTKD